MAEQNLVYPINVVRTAILVDGGFYRKCARHLWGQKSAEDRADELIRYCYAHLKDGAKYEVRSLYRIFYYDCPPIGKSVFHPLKKANVFFDKTPTYRWTIQFFEELKKKRKVALRLGELSDGTANFNLTPEVTKALCTGKKTLSDLTENDFVFDVKQKGVDMKIGLDIASMAYKRQVNQIILIAGDSDFVPAAKLARREGLDFILDPMGSNIKDNLFEHIDGLKSPWKARPSVDTTTGNS